VTRPPIRLSVFAERRSQAARYPREAGWGWRCRRTRLHSLIDLPVPVPPSIRGGRSIAKTVPGAHLDVEASGTAPASRPGAGSRDIAPLVAGHSWRAPQRAAVEEDDACPLIGRSLLAQGGSAGASDDETVLLLLGTRQMRSRVIFLAVTKTVPAGRSLRCTSLNPRLSRRSDPVDRPVPQPP
jgi:hypothetical protein